MSQHQLALHPSIEQMYIVEPAISNTGNSRTRCKLEFKPITLEVFLTHLLSANSNCYPIPLGARVVLKEPSELYRLSNRFSEYFRY